MLFVKVDEPTTLVLCQAMPSLSETVLRFNVHEAFAAKNEHDILVLVNKNLIRSERAFVRNPACIDSHLGHQVRSTDVRGLVFHRSQH